MYCEATSAVDFLCCGQLNNPGEQINNFKTEKFDAAHLHPGSQVVRKNPSLVHKAVPLSDRVVQNTRAGPSAETLLVLNMPQTMINAISKQLLHRFRYKQLCVLIVSRMRTMRILTRKLAFHSFLPVHPGKLQNGSA
jgi:hypothetical protein